jgi:hypothetical protein
MTNGEEASSHAALPRSLSTDERSVSTLELPEAVRTLIEARTGGAVYVVGPDYPKHFWRSSASWRGWHFRDWSPFGER